MPEGFTDEQWREYAANYGTTCAQQFLATCDYMKPHVAREMLNPPECNWDKETQRWFQITFKCSIFDFTDSILLALANRYYFDVIKFERYLIQQFGYQTDGDGESIKDFIARKFSPTDAERVEGLLHRKN